MSLGAAIAIAAIEHKDQKDKAGEDYILHSLAVMDMVSPDREAMIVAVLHDVLEDTPKRGVDKVNLSRQIEDLFGNKIYEAVKAMSHLNGEGYDEYIERVAQNHLARIVKLADLVHNMDPRRIPAYQIVDKDFARWDKYRRALIRLERED